MLPSLFSTFTFSITFSFFFFFFNDTATTEIYTLSLHDALPIFGRGQGEVLRLRGIEGEAQDPVEVAESGPDEGGVLDSLGGLREHLLRGELKGRIASFRSAPLGEGARPFRPGKGLQQALAGRGTGEARVSPEVAGVEEHRLVRIGPPRLRRALGLDARDLPLAQVDEQDLRPPGHDQAPGFPGPVQLGELDQACVAAGVSAHVPRYLRGENLNRGGGLGEGNAATRMVPRLVAGWPRPAGRARLRPRLVLHGHAPGHPRRRHVPGRPQVRP